MANWQEYVQPTTVADALTALREAPGHARLVAGGTDLLLDLQQGRHAPVRRLVDVCSIDEMKHIQVHDEMAFVGAAVPHREIVENTVLAQRAACLVQACALIGGPQVRNVATLGGNVAHALPAGDGTIGLLALDADAEIASAKGRHWLPLGDLFAGPGRTTFDRSSEVLVQFRFRLAGKGEASVFERVMRPQGVAIAILNMACWLRVDDQAHIQELRLAIGPAGPVPLRARRAEQALVGHAPTEETLSAAARLLLDEATLRSSSHRATREYRLHLVEVLLQRTVVPAFCQAAGKRPNPPPEEGPWSRRRPPEQSGGGSAAERREG